MDKAAKDHAEAVQKRQEQEDAERFAPIKNIYEEVRNLPARERPRCSNQCKETVASMWENRLTSRSIEFWGDYSSDTWWLFIDKGTFHLRTSLYNNPVQTEDVEEAKKWLIEKLAKIIPTEEPRKHRG